MGSGPAVIGFDDTDVARHALLESATLLRGQPVLVVVVWEAGRAFDVTDLPSHTLDYPVTNLEVRAAFEADDAAHEAAVRLATHGARLATDAGMVAEGLAVADEVEVADSLVRLAVERDARAIVVGAHSHRGLGKLLLGSTSQAVLHRAPCPVMVVSEPR